MKRDPWMPGANEEWIDGYVRLALNNAGIPDHHGFPHVVKVQSLADHIAKLMLSPVERYAVGIASWLHDLGRIAESAEVGQTTQKTDHAVHSARMARELLTADPMPFDPGEIKIGNEFHSPIKEDLGLIEVIVEAIAQHSQMEPADTLVGRVLQDADRLSRFSWQGVVDTIGHRTTLDPEAVRRMLVRQELDESLDIEQLHKLVQQLGWVDEWYGMLNTYEAREIGLTGWAEFIGVRMAINRLIGGAPIK